MADIMPGMACPQPLPQEVDRSAEPTLSGRLSGMPLVDLLQWTKIAGKTGCLHIQSVGGGTRIYLRGGAVIATSSSETSNLLGQFLLARGRISRVQLREAMEEHERSEDLLGEVLVRRGVLTADQLAEELEAKAEETIFGLFDLKEAGFWFLEKQAPEPGVIEVDLDVQDILMRGSQRQDEMQELERAFPDSHRIAVRDEAVDAASFPGDWLTRKIYDSLETERSVRDVILAVHASSYQVKRRLQEILEAGLVEVLLPAEPVVQGQDEEAVPGRVRPAMMTEDSTPLQSALDEASEHIAGHRYTTALKIIIEAGCAPLTPREARQLSGVEAALVRKLIGEDLPLTRVPVLAKPRDEVLAQKLSPSQIFIAQLADSSWDIKSLLRITPMRGVETLVALKEMLDRDLLELRDGPV